MHYYVCKLKISISIIPFFPCQCLPLLHVYYLQQVILQSECLWVYVPGLCILTDALYLVIVQIFGMAPLFTTLIHFHMDPTWLVALGYFAHHDYLVVCCWIQASLLDPAIITPGGTKHMEICLDHWRSGGIHAKWCPWYHTVVTLHRLFPHVVTAFPLPWLLFGTTVPSIDNHTHSTW